MANKMKKLNSSYEKRIHETMSINSNKTTSLIGDARNTQ